MKKWLSIKVFVFIVSILMYGCTVSPSIAPEYSDAMDGRFFCSETSKWEEMKNEVPEEIAAIHPDGTPVTSENAILEEPEPSSPSGLAAEESLLIGELEETPAYSTEQTFADEMTVRIVDREGEPVANIGVYVNPKAGGPLNRSLSFAVSDQDGVAVIQRIRTSFAEDETVVLALCNRNQSKQPQQQFTMTIPEDTVTPIDIIWHNLAVDDVDVERLDITLLDSMGKPVPNAWLGLSPIGFGPDPSTQQTGSLVYISEYFDWQRCTDEAGKATWLGVEEGEYSVSVFLGIAPFNAVRSDHPRLQKDLNRPIMGHHIIVKGRQEVVISLPQLQD